MKLLAPVLLIAALAAGPALAGAVPLSPSAPGCAASTCGMLLPVASTAADRQALEAARTAFRALPRQERLDLQVRLAVLGYWTAVANDSFGPKLMAAIQSFQRDLGTAPTGMLDARELAALREAASPLLRLWDLKAIRHPYVDATLWVPAGLDLMQETDRAGFAFKSVDGSLKVMFDAYDGLELIAILEGLLDEFPPSTILYRAIEEDFFVLSIRTGATSRYIRFQRIPGGVIGFGLVWSKDALYRGERLSVVMSDLFRASVVLHQPRRPPDPVATTQAHLAPSPSSPAAAPGNAPEAQRKEEAQNKSSSGTGFYVGPGLVLTNAHVVEGCSAVAISLAGTQRPASVLARDAEVDLALIQTPQSGPAPAQLRIGARLGEDVAAFGFPLSGVLASSGNFTRGTITATAGLRDDTRQLQISAPVQPGNSGGPLLDASGNVVGVIVAKLDALKVAAIIDDIPQNINFAIKASMAARFLEEQGVAYTASGPAAALQPADLAALAQTFTVAIRCPP
ncbi:trypsin-like peptidase domain-containing protein [Segnochrobactraceae bacterium EtOH-i3]